MFKDLMGLRHFDERLIHLSEYDRRSFHGRYKARFRDTKAYVWRLTIDLRF